MSSRRSFLMATLTAAVGGAVATAHDTKDTSSSAHDLPPGWDGHENVAILLYNGCTALDVFGPHHFFTLMNGAKVHLVAPKLDTITTDTGIKVSPTLAFADCPTDLTVLLIPGGTAGTLAAAEDTTIRRFVSDRGTKAQWVASVCTGSILLGAAGLLKGYRATSHWLARETLKSFGATPVDERVVVDRNRITGAGVTAGLDFALKLVGKLRGDSYAQAVQLFSEYDPQPPYDAGSPRKSPKDNVQMLEHMHAAFSTQVVDMATRIGFPKP